MTRHVFTYGSLMFAPVWTRVVAGTYRSVEATLRDHARFAIRDETYPGMIASPGSSVAGVLYLDVDAADLARLDDFETEDYRREAVVVVCADGVECRGEAYLYTQVERLLAQSWEPDAFALERFIETYCRDAPGP
jgi:gamma-glutamylcyclotransferase (GGCT)/AIG2-like uncharacterized protein YtfP